MGFITELVKDAVPELFTEGQVLAAEQAFERRIVEYEMNIEQQKLFREDLRDLVELTVGRMDIYHLVGALLLEFCIHFYCENEMLEAEDLPVWVSTIFLLSNLGATGYLVFAVWLSMHASVASHSIGVRLLTRFARLSIPTRMELESIARAPLVPMTERLVQLGQRIGFGRSTLQGSPTSRDAPSRAAPSTAVASEGATSGARGPAAEPSARTSGSGGAAARASDQPRTAPRPILNPSGARRGVATGARVSFPTEPAEESSPRTGLPPRNDPAATSYGSIYDGKPTTAMEEGSKAQADRQRHFRRFLREQRRWLCYDAYARVCMSMGMNQMLTALSYYLVGKVAVKAPGASMISLLGLQWISFLLLRLDVTQGFHVRREALVVICLVPLPPIYIGSLAWVARADPLFHREMVQYSFLPGYLLHGTWLLLVAMVLSSSPSRGGAVDTLAIPRRLRTVLYLDVLHLEQQEVAQSVITQECQSFSSEIRHLSDELECQMRATVEAERASGCVSSTLRRSPEVMQVGLQMQQLLEESQCSMGSSDPAALAEVRRGEWILEHLAVWQRAPEVHASLGALEHHQIKEWLSESTNETVARASRSFLQLCKELDLGILVPAAGEGEGGREAEANAVGQHSSAGGETRVLGVEPSEVPTVRLEYQDGYELTPVWIKPLSDQLSPVQHEEPGDSEPALDPAGLLEGSLPVWMSHALQLWTTPRTPPANLASATEPAAAHSLAHSLEVSTPFQAAGGAPQRFLRRTSSMASESTEQSLIPEEATPPEELPRVIVRRFTLAMSLLWYAAAVIHFVLLLTESSLEAELEVQKLPVVWPEPAGFFEVASLHCNGSLVVVDSGFLLYATHRELGTLGVLTTVGEAGAEALLCGVAGCDVLRMGGAGQLQLAPLAQPFGDQGTSSKLGVPAAWQRATGAWAPCAPAPCEGLALAGWDGARIVVASAQRAPGGEWQVQSRFAVRPDGRSCRWSRWFGHGCAEEPYGAVLALQLLGGGRTLLVLLRGGLLDAWDLEAGASLGRWKLAGASAMCQSGHELLVAREGPGRAPALGIALLPPALTSAACGRSAKRSVELDKFFS